MTQKTKNPAGGPGLSKNALSQNNKEKSTTKPLSLPKKIEFRHEPEQVVNRIGKTVRVVRYHLIDTAKANRLVTHFQRQRGMEVAQ